MLPCPKIAIAPIYRVLIAGFLCCGLTAGLCPAADTAQTDTNCPAYPASARTALLQSNAKVAAFRKFSASRSRTRGALYALTPANNLIDQYIFGKMQADGVAPAPASNDSEFLRRVYLDLTGRIPTVDQTVPGDQRLLQFHLGAIEEQI